MLNLNLAVLLVHGGGCGTSRIQLRRQLIYSPTLRLDNFLTLHSHKITGNSILMCVIIRILIININGRGYQSRFWERSIVALRLFLVPVLLDGHSVWYIHQVLKMFGFSRFLDLLVLLWWWDYFCSFKIEGVVAPWSDTRGLVDYIFGRNLSGTPLIGQRLLVGTDSFLGHFSLGTNIGRLILLSPGVFRCSLLLKRCLRTKLLHTSHFKTWKVILGKAHIIKKLYGLRTLL